MKKPFFFSFLADLYHLIESYSFSFSPHPFMPSQEKILLEDYYLNANCILEFGSGGSTLFAIENGKDIVSVENDKKFFTYLSQHINTNHIRSSANVVFADTGFTGRYGMPLFFPFTLDIERKALVYIHSGFSKCSPDRLDLVFVDGRWRVGCCLYFLIGGFHNALLLLDDYDEDRGYRDTLEKYFYVSRNGRLAKLTSKKNININSLVYDFVISLRDPI